MKLLYLINSAFEQIGKNKFLHIILVIAVMISSAILNYSCSVINMAIYDTTLIESCKDKSLFCVSAKSYYTNVGEMQKPEVLAVYNQIKDQENIEIGLISKNFCTVENHSYNIYVYQDLLNKNISFNLKDGQQLYEYEGNYVPIIVTDNHPILNTYRVGDIIQITVSYYDSLAAFENSTSSKHTVDAILCGIMEKPYRYFESSSTYSSIASDILNQDTDPAIISADWLIDNKDNISDKWNAIMPEIEWFASITSEKGTIEYENAYKFLTSTFKIQTYKNFLNLSRANFKQGIADALYILICMVGLIAVAIGSANIYIGKKQIRSFAINFISGAKWSDCIFIELFRNLTVIILPTVISATVSGLYISSQVPEYYDSGMAVDPMSVIFIVLLMTVLFLISSLPYIIKLKKTEPITFIRTMNRE